jgi:hypothetical protein
MRFMVIVKGSKESEAGVLPTAEELGAMGKYNEELVKAGIMLAGEGLRPSSKGTRITFDAGKVGVIDGPFAEAKELVGGFWILQLKSHEEAVQWLKRCPLGTGVIEIREIAEPEDFAPVDPTGKLREREAELARKLGDPLRAQSSPKS